MHISPRLEMMSVNSNYCQAKFSGKERWPEGVCLYQPEEATQITLPDFVACVSVKTLLRMCQLPYKTVIKDNAEHMSPSGKLPFISSGKLIVSDVKPIFEFVQSKGYNLSAHLSVEDQEQMKSIVQMMKDSMTQAELYMTWHEPTVYSQQTELRYGYAYSWPIGKLLAQRKRAKVQQILQDSGWFLKSKKQVELEVKKCCKTLSKMLGKNTFFFGEKPTEADAIIFGHLYSLLAINLPQVNFSDIIQLHDNLLQFVKTTGNRYFSHPLASNLADRNGFTTAIGSASLRRSSSETELIYLKGEGQINYARGCYSSKDATETKMPPDPDQVEMKLSPISPLDRLTSGTETTDRDHLYHSSRESISSNESTDTKNKAVITSAPAGSGDVGQSQQSALLRRVSQNVIYSINHRRFWVITAKLLFNAGFFLLVGFLAQHGLKQSFKRWPEAESKLIEFHERFNTEVFDWLWNVYGVLLSNLNMV